jgi:hypothetical protein
MCVGGGRQAVAKFEETVKRIEDEGGKILVGGERHQPDGLKVRKGIKASCRLRLLCVVVCDGGGVIVVPCGVCRATS